MNLDKKLELAHEYAIAMIMGENRKESAEKFAITAFDLADAMEAEYNKREKEQKEKNSEESKKFFDKLTKNGDGSCKPVPPTVETPPIKIIGGG